MYSRDELPGFCESLLPALPVEEEAAAATVDTLQCIGPIYTGKYIDFSGGNISYSLSIIYSDADCTIVYDVLDIIYVWAPSGTSEDVLCDSALPGSIGILIDSDIYYCT